MPLVPAICPQCGGKINVDNAQKAAVCIFCGTPFIVQEAIENHNHYTVNQFGEGANVTINEGTSRERYLSNGNTALRLRNYDLALDTFQKFTRDYPQAYEAWWGLILSTTQHFSNLAEGSQRTNQWMGYVKALASPAQYAACLNEYCKYLQAIAAANAGKERASVDNFRREQEKRLNAFSLTGKEKRTDFIIIGIISGLAGLFLVLDGTFRFIDAGQTEPLVPEIICGVLLMIPIVKGLFSILSEKKETKTKAAPYYEKLRLCDDYLAAGDRITAIFYRNEFSKIGQAIPFDGEAENIRNETLAMLGNSQKQR